MSKNRTIRRAMARQKGKATRDRFEIVTDEIRIRLQQENIHGIIYMGKGDGIFAGGLVGDVQVIGETLLTACMQNESVFELFKIIVNTAEEKKGKSESKQPKKNKKK